MSVQILANAGPARRPLIPAHDRIGLSRAEAAEYIGVSTSLFEERVADGRMPPPKQINSRKVYAPCSASVPPRRTGRGTSCRSRWP
jgi:predicted DNA-binding transcriptional regulator AlpA